MTGVSNYEFRLTDTTAGTVSTIPVNGTSWTPSQALFPSDNYVWSVGAIGATNKITWDRPLSFTILPTALAPSGPLTNVEPTFTWTGVTGVGNYEVRLVDETIDQVVNTVVAGTSWTPSQPLNLNDSYAWRVGAIGANNRIGWGGSLFFTIPLTAFGPSGSITTLLPTFTWSDITGVPSYEVRLADRTTGQVVNTVVAGASWTPTAPLNLNNTYVWSVGAIGANNTVTRWSSPLTFAIPPLTGIGPSGTISTRLPTFTWNGVTGVSSYEIWLTDQTTHLIVTAITSGSSWTPSQPLNLGDQYSWRVGAVGAPKT